MAGGDGLGKGEANKAINPVTGETATGSTSSIDAGKFDTYLRENPYVDGVFIPSKNRPRLYLLQDLPFMMHLSAIKQPLGITSSTGHHRDSPPPQSMELITPPNLIG